MLLCILFIFLGAGITTGVGYAISQPSQPKKIKTPLPATLFSMKDAPTDSIDGHISSMSGQVEWQSRVATMPAALATAIPLQQGESILTKDNGSMTISFPKIGKFNISSESELNIIQTLPTSAVMEQPKGQIQYTKIGTTPLAVKSVDLLIQIDSGVVAVTSDDQEQTVTVDIISGKASVAYEDQNHITSVQNLYDGDEYFFDNTTDQGDLK